MKLADFLFRFRRMALIAVFAVAFWAPWERMGGAHPGSTWLWLAGTLQTMGFFPIATSTVVVTAIATLALLLAALVRTWASAYLGFYVVYDRDLHSERVVADGPYRYVRNPLYIGTWLLTAGISILMPPGGALFALVAVTLLIVAWVTGRGTKADHRAGRRLHRVSKKSSAFFSGDDTQNSRRRSAAPLVAGCSGGNSSLGNDAHIPDLCASLQRDHPGAGSVDLGWHHVPGARDLATRNTSKFLDSLRQGAMMFSAAYKRHFLHRRRLTQSGAGWVDESLSPAPWQHPGQAVVAWPMQRIV